MAKKDNTEKEEKRSPLPKDWDRVRVLYLRNYELDYIVKQLPDVDLSPTLIMDKMRKEGMDKKKKEINLRVLETMTDEVVAEREKTSRGCVKAYKSGLDIIQTLLSDYKMEQEAGGNPKRCTAYNMDLLMSGLNKIQKGFDAAFGEDKNGKLYEKEPDVIVIEGIDEKKL